MSAGCLTSLNQSDPDVAQEEREVVSRPFYPCCGLDRVNVFISSFLTHCPTIELLTQTQVSRLYLTIWVTLRRRDKRGPLGLIVVQSVRSMTLERRRWKEQSSQKKKKVEDRGKEQKE